MTKARKGVYAAVASDGSVIAGLNESSGDF